MENYGFTTVAAGIPSVKVADVAFNARQIQQMAIDASLKGAEIVVFPELSLTGYSCQDLFRSESLLDQAEEALQTLASVLEDYDVIAIIGLPLRIDGMLINGAAVISHGRIHGVVAKTFLPNYGEFYEKRWFASSQDIGRDRIMRIGNHTIAVTDRPQLFLTHSGVKFGIEICEDLWSPAPPSNNLALAGADIVFNLSASDELIGKHAYLRALVAQQSARTISGYVYAGCGFGESTQDVVYGGNAFVYENGNCLSESKRFSQEAQLVMAQVDVEKLRGERRANTTFVNAQSCSDAIVIETTAACNREHAACGFQLTRNIEPRPFIPKSTDMQDSCEEILSIQMAGLAKRLQHTRCANVVIGISGGLDSTLALLVCVRAFDYLGLDRKGIHGVTMPGFGTTDRTHGNACALMDALGVTQHEISIAKSVTQHFEDIGHDINVHDVTYENGQARERTQILMDLANKFGGMVIGTGDLSELALGWATYNGDHMSMYGVNASVPKTLIKYLVSYFAGRYTDEACRATLLDIIDTPISPELIPADENGQIKQKTEDLVGPYELHDFFLYHYLRFGFRPAKLFLMARRAFDGSHPEVAIYDDATIIHWMRTFFRRFFAQQFKRSCLPDGPKVGSVSLSPRGDWRMPSDASSALWLKEIDDIRVM